MCFKPKVPKIKPIKTPQIKVPDPISQDPTVTQTGADTAAVNTQKKQNAAGKSLFQIDLTIPTGASTGETSVNNTASGPSTGAAVR
jgi:hypothetical protein